METWIPPGVRVESQKKIFLALCYGIHLESMDSTWTSMDSRWSPDGIPTDFFLIFKNRHSTKKKKNYLNTYFIIYIKLFILNLLHLYYIYLYLNRCIIKHKNQIKK